MSLAEQIVDYLEIELKRAKGELRNYIADGLIRIADAPLPDKPEVSRLVAQNVQLKAAEVALKKADAADDLMVILLQVGLAAAAERAAGQIREL